VNSNVLVSLFESTVLSDVVKVVSSDDNCSLHLGGDDLSRKNSSSDGDISNKRALLVDEGSLNSGIGGLDSESNVLDEANGLLAGASDSTLAGYEDSILLLVCLFVLIALDVVLSNSNHLSILTDTLPFGEEDNEQNATKTEVRNIEPHDAFETKYMNGSMVLIVDNNCSAERTTVLSVHRSIARCSDLLSVQHHVLVRDHP